MSLLPPQTISLKRRRHEAPVDALHFDQTDSSKRRKSDYAYRRLTKPSDTPASSQLPPAPSPAPTTERRFQLEAASVSGAKRIFIEARPPPTQDNNTQNNDSDNGPAHAQPQPSIPDSTLGSTPRPRKRPGAASALGHASKTSLHHPTRIEPSKDDLHRLEALTQEVEKTDNLHMPLPISSPSKHRPKAPAQRFAARHPEKAAALNHDTGDSEMIDLDTDDFVIETYIREPLLLDAPLPCGTIGLLVLNDTDDDWWNGSDSGSETFDTDDEDENAEDHYANDYPEDELSEDDEIGRDVYQKGYRRGSDDEEWGATTLDSDNDDAALASGEDEDDLHDKMTQVPKMKRVAVGYWGTAGEAM